MFTETVSKIKKSVFAVIQPQKDENGEEFVFISTGFMYAPKFIITQGYPFFDTPKGTFFQIAEADNFTNTTQGFLVEVDRELDLAIFRIERTAASSSVKLSKKTIPVGTKCGTLGFPGSRLTDKGVALSLKFQSAYVAESFKSVESNRNTNWYILDTATYHGSSGAPVFTDDGKVFGMICLNLTEEDLGVHEEQMMFSRCISSQDILKFSSGIKLSKRSLKK